MKTVTLNDETWEVVLAALDESIDEHDGLSDGRQTEFLAARSALTKAMQNLHHSEG